MKTRSILIVDDEKEHADSLAMFLRNELNVETKCVYSGGDALNILKKQNYDLMITDIMMPGLNGLDLLVFAKKSHPHMQAIVITGVGRSMLRERALERGALHFLEKPYDVQEMIDLVSEMLEEEETGFKGKIQDLQLVDIIQMNCLSRSTNALYVRNKQENGVILFMDGDIVHSEVNQLVGETALNHILSWSGGSFDVKPLEDVPYRSIQQNWEHLLIEAMRLQDEKNRDAMEDQHVLDKAGFGTNEGVISRQLKVLIVDDSPFMRKAIRKILESDTVEHELETAKDGREAIQKAVSFRPDVITMDVMMPGMDGITALKNIMVRSPRPVVMISSLTQEGASLTFDCLRFGAVDFVTKPSQNNSSDDIKNQLADILQKVHRAANVQIQAVQRVHISSRASSATPPMQTRQSSRKLVVIGASAGGYATLIKILPNIPEDIPAAILVVQYMPPQFVESFSTYLTKVSKIPTIPAKNNLLIQDGICYLVAGRNYMGIDHSSKQLKIRLTEETSHMDYKTIDLLMISAVEAVNKNVLGIILTGLGDDGLEGSGVVHQKGGRVIVQSQESALYSEMPQAVIKTNTVDQILPDALMADAIVRWANS